MCNITVKGKETRIVEEECALRVEGQGNEENRRRGVCFSCAASSCFITINSKAGETRIVGEEVAASQSREREKGTEEGAVTQ